MRWSVLLLPLLLLACLVACDDSRPEEEDVPTDGKLDSFRSPTDHGELAFGTTQRAKLTADAAHHVWSFTLSGPASIHPYTSRVPHEASVDTVLYLYRRGPTGWGSYIARNDDDGRAHWSSLDRDLPAGEYRVLVKGLLASTRGSFNLTLDCAGTGCAPAPSCLFGSTYGDIAGNPNLAVSGTQRLTSPAGLSDVDQQRIVIALHQSSHTDVTTVAEAFAAADQGEINITRMYEPAAARSFTAIEYGAGDNSYGAIFYWDSTELVSKIHDGDLEGCTVQPEVCLLGQSWGELKTSPAFTPVASRVVTTAAQLTGVPAQQALKAIRVAYTDATDLADGLGKIDQSELNVITLRHTATGQLVDVFEYGAGDNSYGAVFAGGTLDTAAEIHDLDFYGCSLFQ